MAVNKKIFTEVEKQFIKDNRHLMSMKDLGEWIGVSATPVRRYMIENKLQISKESSYAIRAAKLSGRTSYTTEEDDYISANFLKMPIKTIARKIGRSGCGVRNRMKHLKLIVPEELTQQWKEAARYKKGSVPMNKGLKQEDYMSSQAIAKTKKTRFKKGSTPHNHKCVGSERVTKDGYIEVKVREPNVWKLKQRIIWERSKGKIAKGMNVQFKDLNRTNCEIDNLYLVSRVEQIMHNKYGGDKLPYEAKEVVTTLIKFNKTIKEKEDE